MMAGKAPGTVSWKEELEDLVVLHLDAQRNEAWHLGRELVAEGKPVGSFPVFSLSWVRVTQRP